MTDKLRRPRAQTIVAAAAVAAFIALAAGVVVTRAQPRAIVSASPYPGSTYVSAGASIGLTFAQDMNRASVEAAFTVSPAVTGELRWVSDREFYLIPRNPMALKALYEARLGTGALDSAGRAILTGPYAWSFTTWETDPQIRFSYGVPIQLVTPASGRGVPVQVGYPRLDLDVVIYRLDEPGFVRRASGLQSGDGAVIDVTGLPVHASFNTFVDSFDKSGEITFPTGTPPGLYVVEASHLRVKSARSLVVFSDFALVGKVGLSELTFWATTVPGGQPAPGASVRVYDKTGSLLGNGATDEIGGATFPRNPAATFAAATSGGQTTMLGLESPWLSQRTYWWWDGNYVSQPPTHVGHVHTDRPIYRPGHTVHWKATLRALTADGYVLPAPSAPVTITIRDTGGNMVAQSAFAPDGFGSITGDLPVGPDASLGTWQIETAIGGTLLHGQFEVAEYVKPDFAVTVDTDNNWYVTGDQATVTVQADYYFGQPVAGGEVTLRLFQAAYWRGGGTEVATYKGVADADGSWSVDLPVPGPSWDGEPYVFEAEVVDDSRRPVFAEAIATVYNADVSLSVQPERYGVDAGQPVRLHISTTDHDGKPVPNRDVTVTANTWVCCDGRYREQIRRTVGTDKDGLATLDLDLPAGWFYLDSQTIDRKGRVVQQNAYAWVMDQRYPWYWNEGLEVTADRDHYAAGDTARLLIKSPVTTTALVTLEREDVVEELIVEVAGATEVEIPIRADMAPNVWVKVHVWDARENSGYGESQAEARLITAETNLLIDAADRRLNVQVTSDRSTYEPGNPAVFTLRVTDAAGAAVDAQVSLAVVDKAVLALKADTSGDIFDGFWSARSDTVSTYDGLRPSDWYGYPERDRAGAGPPGAAGTPTMAASPTQGSPDDEEPSTASPRREFPDTAYWASSLETGPDGTVQVTLNLPDTLTTWKALARAVTRTTQAGQGSAELLVTKAIIADPALPRFAVQGDTFALDVLARNYTAGELEGSVAIDTPGLTQLDPGAQTLALPVGQTRFARWSVVASEIGLHTLGASVTTAAGSDSIELPLEIQPFSIPERFVRAGSTQAVATEAYTVPFNAVPEGSSVDLYLAPGVAAGVLQGVDDLIGYPYGCVEQTMSRLMPDAVVGRLIQELDIAPPDSLAELPAMIALGLQKLYGYQNPDGGWGWWHGDSRLFTTAYVLHGLTLVGEAGETVDPAALARGFAFLEAAVASPPEGPDADDNVLAYGQYVLALGGRGQPEALQRLYARSARLDSFSLAALAVALHDTGLNAEAQAALTTLESRAVQAGSTAFWPFAEQDALWKPYYWYTMASQEKNTAMALGALAKLRPGSALAPKAARWLLEHRNGGGWRTTQATSYAVLGLTDYLIASGELQSDYTWTVSVDGSELARGHVDPTNVTDAMPPISLAAAAVAPGIHTMTFAKEGTGTLYYTSVTNLALYHEGFAAAEPAGVGITVSRDYQPIKGRTGPDGWHVGDLVNVRVTVDVPDEMWYLIIEDPLPAGLEALNDALDTESGRVPPADPGDWWRWYGYERKELRDDRVTFFSTYMWPGKHTFDYAARAVTPGTFSVRPAEAYAMYRPEIWGRSASDQFEVATQALAKRPGLAGDFDRDCRLTAFDAAMVAHAWTDGVGRDVNDDARVDAADIALAVSRAGASCGDGVALPDISAATIGLELRSVAGDGSTFEVVAHPNSATVNLAALDVSLTLPAGSRVASFHAGPALAGAALIGPIGKTGTARLGAYLLDGVEIGDPTVLLTFTLADGTGEMAVSCAVLASDRGAEHHVTFAGATVSPEPGPLERVWLPRVNQR